MIFMNLTSKVFQEHPTDHKRTSVVPDIRMFSPRAYISPKTGSIGPIEAQKRGFVGFFESLIVFWVFIGFKYSKMANSSCRTYSIIFRKIFWNHWSQGVAYGVWIQGPYHVWTACGAPSVSHTSPTPTAGSTQMNSIDDRYCSNAVGTRKGNISVAPMCLSVGVCRQQCALSWNVQDRETHARNSGASRIKDVANLWVAEAKAYNTRMSVQADAQTTAPK